MSDLTDRLRKNTEGSHLWWAKLHTEAADEIDQCHARIEALQNECDANNDEVMLLTAERDALRETQAKFGQVQHDLLSQIDALREQLALAESVRAAQVAGLTEVKHHE
jgi:predicted nuclease with TOPRIM domain